MKIVNKMATRLNATIALITVQIAFVIFIAGVIFSIFPLIVYAGVLASIFSVLFIIKSDKESAYKITWIIVVLAMPIIGGAIYILMGNKRPTRKIAAHMKEHALIARLLDGDGNLPFVSKIQCGRMYSLMQYIRNCSSYHAYKNTYVSYLSLWRGHV
ncbi:MAG: PLD nuclease N-terminal domain-containing protein [Defluviitaleaceae bacterium]|nr:PLD nuclease N-terminal domain-containing protein [Defluviitaleaceae bacterium]